MSYDAEAKHEGKLYAFPISDLPFLQCGKCDAKGFDDQTNEAISSGLRSHLGLLQPGEIKENLKRIGFNQKAFAKLLGFAEETLSRWVRGAVIQSRAMDNFMRVTFKAHNTVESIVGEHAEGPSISRQSGQQILEHANRLHSTNADYDGWTAEDDSATDARAQDFSLN